MKNLRNRLPLPLALVAIVYTAATAFAFGIGGFRHVYMTVANEPSSLSFDAHIAINRTFYSLLCILLWASAFSIRRLPRVTAVSLSVALILMYLDFGGSYFDLFSSILHAAPKNPGFDRFYNEWRVHERLWQLSLLLVFGSALLCFRAWWRGAAANNPVWTPPSSS